MIVVQAGPWRAEVAEVPDGCCVTLYRVVTTLHPHSTRSGWAVVGEGRRFVSCEVLPLPFHAAMDAAHDTVIRLECSGAGHGRGL